MTNNDLLVMTILNQTSDPESEFHSLVSFPTRNSALFNSPVAQRISTFLTKMGYTIDVVNSNMIEWQYNEELATGRDPRD